MTAERSAGAVRQDRWRRHRRGDHSICLEGHCDAVTPPPAEDTSPEATALEATSQAPGTHPTEDAPPEEFGPSGQALWDGTLKFGSLTAPQRVLLREACRMADRADLLNRLINEEPDSDDLWRRMREARQGATTLKNIVAELRQSGVAGGSGTANPDDDKERSEVSQNPATSEGGPGVASLAARIAAKRAQAAG
jgi:hypothetical protein